MCGLFPAAQDPCLDKLALPSEDVELRLPSHHAFSTKNVQGLAKTRASGCEFARPARQKCGD